MTAGAWQRPVRSNTPSCCTCMLFQGLTRGREGGCWYGCSGFLISRHAICHLWASCLPETPHALCPLVLRASSLNSRPALALNQRLVTLRLTSRRIQGNLLLRPSLVMNLAFKAPTTDCYCPRRSGMFKGRLLSISSFRSSHFLVIVSVYFDGYELVC